MKDGNGKKLDLKKLDNQDCSKALQVRRLTVKMVKWLTDKKIKC
jgi:hypothetical protein